MEYFFSLEDFPCNFHVISKEMGGKIATTTGGSKVGQKIICEKSKIYKNSQNALKIKKKINYWLYRWSNIW
jgi:hypothetical protein